MRLAACAFSAVLLSGCSWLGYDNSSYYDNSMFASKNTRQAGQRAQNVYSPRRAQNQYGNTNNQAGQYTSGGYGSHAANAQSNVQYQPAARKLRKPKLRGSLGLEIDHSVSGDLYETSSSLTPTTYNRADYQEGFVSGSVASGQVVSTVYTSIAERIVAPNISIDDVYTAPFRVSGGLEYILNNHNTLFANAGYTRSEGKKGGGVSIIDELRKVVTTSNYITDPALGPVGAFLGSTTNTTFIPNKQVAAYSYEFNDSERLDLEVGARHYFNPIMPGENGRTITPFVGASGGAARYNEVTVTENQRQRFLGKAFEGTETNPNGDYYDVNFGVPVQIYDAQWVPYGALKAGVEWQLTPKTALAFETGVKYEGNRDFSNGTKGDVNITIPVAIRGSYNF